jgi:REP-associated tyrosine transposase
MDERPRRQRPRDTAPGIRHVIVGAASPELYYRDDVDNATWIRRLVATLDRHEWTCIAFCQLPTHVHVVVDVPNDSLPVGMHWLSSEYGKDYNARHGRVGALVRGRYWARRIEDDADLLGVVTYNALNPVQAGLVAEPEHWHWSSYATSVGLSESFPFVDATALLVQLGASPAAATRALRGHVSRRKGRVR